MLSQHLQWYSSLHGRISILFEMKKHEQLATETGQLFDPNKAIPGQLKEDFPVHAHGRVRDLSCTNCDTCCSDICQ